MKNYKKILIGLIIGITFSLSVSAGIVGPSDGGLTVPGKWFITSSDSLAPVNDRDVEMGNVNITGNITGILELANDTWMRAIDNAGTGVVNMIKVNTSDLIEFGADVSTLSMANDNWFRARNNADSDYINAFKVNTSDEIEVGGTLLSGNIEFDTDSGVATIVDMPVSATPVAGTEMSYTMKIDGTNIFKIYSEADSSGSVENERVEVLKPILYSQAPQVLTGAGAVDTTSAITHIVTNAANALTLADGEEGQIKFIVMKTDGGAGTLTPTSFANGTTLTFDDVGDSVELLFTNNSWHWMGGIATRG